MRITKDRLRQIIKEEIDGVVGEGRFDSMEFADVPGKEDPRQLAPEDPAWSPEEEAAGGRENMIARLRRQIDDLSAALDKLASPVSESEEKTEEK